MRRLDRGVPRVVSARKSCRCGSDGAEAFATLSAAASEEWEARRIGSQSMERDTGDGMRCKPTVRGPECCCIVCNWMRG